MILASAQTSPKQGDIESNLIDHYNLIDLASKNKAKLIVFPEMSLTGYEREGARDLAFIESDSRLYKLRQLSAKNNMIIIVGAPILIRQVLHIGSFILKPDNSVDIYTKQFLHNGEEEFFKPSFSFNPYFSIDNEKISVAICADIDNPEHPEYANNNNVTIYIASIFFTSNGIPNAYKTLAEYAQRFQMNILMSNYCGKCWGLESGGQSAFWDKQGKLIGNLDKDGLGLLIVEKTDKCWISKTAIT